MFEASHWLDCFLWVSQRPRLQYSVSKSGHIHTYVRVSVLINRTRQGTPVSLKLFSIISEIKRNWNRLACVSLVQLKNSVIFFRFKFFASLQLSYFRFDAKQAKSCLVSLPSETKYPLRFQFSLPKRKRGRTLGHQGYVSGPELVLVGWIRIRIRIGSVVACL